MGAVYLAREVALGRVVAVKVLAAALAADEGFRLRFEHEARSAAAISHPNIIQVYTVGEMAGDPPLPYIIMQYVDGVALEELMAREGPFPERRARRILRDVAAALAAAHAGDVIHRDIKPANILIESATGRAYVADFGISLALSPRGVGGAEPIQDDGLIVGTALYMSPEQASGDVVGPRSDVYCLGVVAYELLSGALPFEAKSPAGWRAAHVADQPAPLRDRRQGISDDLVRLVDRCLSKEPEARPGAADLASELLPSAEDEILWPPPGLVDLPRLGRWQRRAAMVLIAAATLLVGTLAIPLPGVHAGAGWWDVWGGGNVVAAGNAGAGEWAIVLWQVAVLLGSVMLAVGLALLVGLVTRTWSGILGLRARGWRADTIRDALSDPDGRTGMILSGSGEFAAMTSVGCDRVRRFRRLAHGALLAGAGWIGVTLTVWALSVLAGSPLQPAGGPSVGPVHLFVVLVPLLSALAVAGGALAQERRATRSSWRRAHTGSYAVPSDGSPGEISTWYAELVGDPGPAPPRRPPSPALLRAVGFGAACLGGWCLVAIGLLVTATLLAGRLTRRLGAETAMVAAYVGRPDGGDVLADSRAALRRYLPTVGGSLLPSDTLLAGLVAPSPAGLPLYPVEPRLVLGSRQPGLAATTLVADAIGRAAGLSADTLRMLASLAEHPRTRRIRALARAPGVMLPLEGDASSAIRTAMEANAAGAVLAAARGDFGEAAARLGENGAIAEMAVTAPGGNWPVAGLHMLQSLALLPLAEVARLRGERGWEAELRRLAGGVAEASARFGPSWRLGGIGLGSDPRDFRLLHELQADARVPPGLRAAAVEVSGEAVCLNPREWLAGADAARDVELGGGQRVPEVFRSHGIARVAERVRYCAERSGG